MGELYIRGIRETDTEAVLEIYTPYILETAISFEFIPPKTEEFAERIRRVTAFYPWLVAERNGEIAGYAYANRLGVRAGYDRAVETSIYVRRERKNQGVGRALYEALEKALAMQNVFHLFACIAWSDTEDEYLNHGSVLFHQRRGYQLSGQLHQSGYKFGRWYDTVWMEKHLPGISDAAPCAFPEVSERFFADYS